jgi:hypothetical protein
MSATTYPKPRLAVFYDAAAGPTVYRIAVEIAAKAWDAGCGVRVRRLGDVIVPDGSELHPDWIEMLSDAPDIPEAGTADVEWASVAVILSEASGPQSARNDVTGSTREARHAGTVLAAAPTTTNAVAEPTSSSAFVAVIP